MTDLIANLSLGFSVAFTPVNLSLAFIGCLVGTLIGVLPGLAQLPQSPCCCRSPLVWTRPVR